MHAVDFCTHLQVVGGLAEGHEAIYWGPSVPDSRLTNQEEFDYERIHWPIELGPQNSQRNCLLSVLSLDPSIALCTNHNRSVFCEVGLTNLPYTGVASDIL